MNKNIFVNGVCYENNFDGVYSLCKFINYGNMFDNLNIASYIIKNNIDIDKININCTDVNKELIVKDIENLKHLEEIDLSVEEDLIWIQYIRNVMLYDIHKEIQGDKDYYYHDLKFMTNKKIEDIKKRINDYLVN